MTLLAGLVAIHLLMNATTNDFEWFRSVLDNQTLGEFLVSRYQTWSSRLIIEAALVTITHALLVWHVLDIAMCLLLFVSIRSIVSPSDQHRSYMSWIILLLMACYPIMDMSSAGWVATTMNYSWPLALGMFSMATMVRYMRAHDDSPTVRKTQAPSKPIIALSLTSALVAANVEQSALLLFGFTLVFVAYSRWNRLPLGVLLAHLAISLIGIVFILLCPGNANRNTTEAQTWWPNNHNFKIPADYADFSMADKTYLGISTTLDRYLFLSNAFMCVFAITLALLILRQRPIGKRGGLQAAIAIVVCVPFMARFLLGALSPLLPDRLVAIMNYAGYDVSILRVTLIAGQIALCALILAELYWVYGRTLQFLTTVVILLAGFMSRVIMGFSPTLFASQGRTFIFADFCLMCVTAMLLHTLTKRNSRTERIVILVILGGFAAATLIPSVVDLIAPAI
ncbi:hypothetical protein [Bifidobacterium eulemuris]|nr:hypothetical protein [Bifidobacterium eulemuris]